jgi:hypothetical protein
MASLVGQLERYAEAKTGRARTTGLRPYDDDEDAFNALGGSNLANRGSNSARSGAETLAAPKRAAQSKATGTNRWGARRSANAAASMRRNGLNASYGMGPENGDVEGRVGESRFQDENRRGDVGSVVDPTYQNSLVGGWDAGSVPSSRWETSSVPDSDVRSVYSAALEDSFGGAYVLPDAPKDEVARVDERASSAAENLTRQRAALEAQMSNIARATRASDAAASLETDGMFTAGKTKTGVGVIDFFARDPGGTGPKGSLAKISQRASQNERREKQMALAGARAAFGTNDGAAGGTVADRAHAALGLRMRVRGSVNAEGRSSSRS